jgi:hypothetical protein
MAAADLDGCDRRPVLLGDVVLADNADVVVAAIGPLDNVAIGPQGGRILFGPPQSAIQVTLGPVLVTVCRARGAGVGLAAGDHPGGRAA